MNRPARVPRGATVLAPEQLDLRAWLRAGDQVVCGQVSAEPLTLTRRLVRCVTEHALPVTALVGTLYGDTFDAGPPGLRFVSYGAIGRAAALAERGQLAIVSERYSRWPALFAQGQLRADVVLLQAAIDPSGELSWGLACDYTLDAARRARVVLVELNPWAPWTHGTPWPQDLHVHAWVQAEAPPLVLAPAHIDAASAAIAQHVAGLVPDGATLQVGVGALPDATLAALAQHRHLGLHSGVLGDAGVALMQAGVIDNSRKGADAGIGVTNTLAGGADTFRFVHRNAQVEVRHSHATHLPAALAPQRLLHAINGALEVDLSGQVNCESLRGKPRGGIGGLLDFSRAARECAGGKAITVLPASAKGASAKETSAKETSAKGASAAHAGGRTSRIVAQLSGPATVGRADVDVVVTEHGVADLRNASLAERAQRLIAIAAPEFREGLQAQARQLLA